MDGDKENNEAKMANNRTSDFSDKSGFSYSYKVPDQLQVGFPALILKVLTIFGIVGPGLKHRVKHSTFCLTMRCFSDVLKKTSTSIIIQIYSNIFRHN